MTAITITADDSATKIKRNAEIARKSISTYVVHVASLGAALLLAVGPDWVTAFIQQHWAVATAGPLVSLAFWWVARLAPQTITLASDKQKAAREWVLSKLTPGEVALLPAAIAKAAGLPSVMDHDPDDGYMETLPPPVVPVAPAPAAAPVAAPAPPMPGTAVMGDLQTLLAKSEATPAHAAVAPDPDLAQRLRAAAPWRSSSEAAAMAASWTQPPILITAP